MPKRKRSRSRQRGGSGRFWQITVLVGAVIAVSTLAFGVGAFSTADADRSASVGAASDQNSLIGLDTVESISTDDGEDDPTCDVGTNPVRVKSPGGGKAPDIDESRGVIIETSSRVGDVDSSTGVIIESGARVKGSIDTEGCVAVNSGARAEGDVAAGGVVIIHSGARIEGPLLSTGSVIIHNGGRADKSVDVDGSILLKSGTRIDGTADAGGDVSLESGARINKAVDASGDVNLASGARINADADADGDVTLERRNQINGVITAGGTIIERAGGWEGADSSQGQQLTTVTNNFNSDMRVTVSLRDSSDGTLAAPNSGAGSGSTISFVLSSGSSQRIDIAPEDSIVSPLRFTVDAEALNDESSVSVERSVTVES